MVDPEPRTRPGISGMLLSWGLGYLRWTQFIPMVTGWFGVAFLLGALFFGRFAVGFEELAPETQANFWSSPIVKNGIEHAAQSVEFINARYRSADDEFDLRSFIWEAWSLLALVGFLLSLLLGALNIHFRPRSLGQKIRIVGIVSVTLAVISSLVFLSFGELLTSSIISVVFWGFYVVAIPFLLTCWGLWVSNLISAAEVMLGLRDSLPEPPESLSGNGSV